MEQTANNHTKQTNIPTNKHTNEQTSEGIIAKQDTHTDKQTNKLNTH